MSTPSSHGLSAAASQRREGKRYAPCRNGVHVCGADEEANEFYTERNFPRANRKVFERARAECGARDDEPTDFVVDFMLFGDIEDDFRMTRQMLDRLAVIADEPRGLSAAEGASPERENRSESDQS